MATTYCERSDIETILSVAGLLACIDDDESGDESPEESQHVVNAIERSAVKLNAQVGRQYILADVANNAWMKWANAVLASAMLKRRRDNPLSETLAADVKEVEELANEIAWGRRSLPEQVPSFDHSASLTNFKVEMGHQSSPVRVSVSESTGNAPEPGVKRNISSPIYPY